MPRGTDNQDIITDSEVDDEILADNEELEAGDEEVDDSLMDPRELIADQLEARRQGLSDDEGEPVVQEEEEEPEEEPEEKPELFTVKIDGVEKQVDKDELIRNYQLENASRMRMEEANTLIKQFGAKLAATGEQSTETDDEVDTTPVDFDVQDFVQQIREGSDDDALTAATNLVSAVTTTSVPDVGSLVDQRLQEVRDQEAAEAAEAEKAALVAAEGKFKRDFSDDISANERFFDLASMEDRMLAEDPEWQEQPIDARFAEAGRRAQEWLAGKSLAINKANKQKLKARAVPVRRAMHRADIGSDTTSQAPTRSSVIAEMKAARGQVL